MKYLTGKVRPETTNLNFDHGTVKLSIADSMKKARGFCIKNMFVFSHAVFPVFILWNIAESFEFNLYWKLFIGIDYVLDRFDSYKENVLLAFWLYGKTQLLIKFWIRFYSEHQRDLIHGSVRLSACLFLLASWEVFATTLTSTIVEEYGREF